MGVLGEEFNSERVALQVAGISCLGVNVRQKDKDGHFTGHWLLLPADQRAALALYRGGAEGWWWDSVMQLLSCSREEMLSSRTLPPHPHPPSRQAVVSMGAASSRRILMFAAVRLPMLSSLVFYTTPPS